jgi:AcrR family transcriptional regulator
MRERILFEAANLIARRGYFGTSTRQIAVAAGIRQPSLFHHFSSKDEIMQVLLSYSLDAPSEYAAALAEQNGSAAERLYKYMRFDVRHVARSPYNLSGLHGDDVMESPGFELWRAEREAIRTGVQTIIAQGVESGEFIPIDPELARHMIINLILATIVLYSGKPVPADDLPDTIASFGLRALLADPAHLDSIRTTISEGS